MGSSMSSASIVLLVWFLTLATFHVWLCNGSSRSNNTITTCSETERQALLKFKQDLKDPSNRLSSWADHNQDCCHWAGVVCHNFTGHVREIHLQNPYNNDPHKTDCYNEAVVEYHAQQIRHKLGGKVNPSLLNLKHLQYLDLSSNDFDGTDIPSFIGSIANLRYLNLSLSGFSGTIPPQLGNLTKIRYLDLASKLGLWLGSKNLQWLSGLVSLQYLDMSGVDLYNALDWLQVTSNLPSLIELHLSNCLLNYHVSPPSTSNKINFTSLAILDLSYNLGLGSSIPSWIFTLNHLDSLNVYRCEFQGPIPNSLQNMTSLRVVDLFGNFFGSTIPNGLYTLTHLESLRLQRSNLQGVISSVIGNLTSLINLDLSSNQLEGSIPTSLGKLCNLKKIDLSGNQFVGGEVADIFRGFSQCKSQKLETVNLSWNNFLGHLPDELGQLKSLVDFDLHNNSFSGPIPMSVGRLSSLIKLTLSNNKLNGTLPESLGQLAKLEYLKLSHNLLKGVVYDAHFANLVRLRYLNADRNCLTLKVNESWNPPFQVEYLSLDSWQLGPQFPSWFLSQRNLTSLSIAHTGIFDSITMGFWPTFSQFKYVNFSHNQMHGDISSLPNVMPPDSAIDLNSNCFNSSLPLVPSNLGFLDLSNNFFSGSIYHFLCGGKGEKEQKTLWLLNLGNNLLSEKIPDCWKHWGKLEILKLENNNLAGSIPSSIGHLRSLVSLHLRHNNLSGELPWTLQYCTTLWIIDLGENRFTGSIPPWMGNSFPSLVVLNLRSNNFLSNLPSELCCLSFLQILDVAHNNLSGLVPRCFANLSAMAETHISSFSMYFFQELNGHYVRENAFLVAKGRVIEYSTTLGLVTSMDLSENNLSGEIPERLTKLVGLWSLNLSGNHLIGRIPRNIGEMRQLESIDLSLNQLSGEIPSSISNLAFLSHLNLSYNNLAGRIPSSTQLQSLNESSFVGNNLCGPPLANCNENNTIPLKVGLSGSEEEGEGYSDALFFATIALGFAVGFWIVWGPLLFKRSWRLAYFQVLEDGWYKLCGFFFIYRHMLCK